MQDLKNLKCLLPDTQTLLAELIENCDFLEKYVLVGGSALSLHLCHRKSEDLDFFTWTDSFDSAVDSKPQFFNFLNTKSSFFSNRLVIQNIQ